MTDVKHREVTYVLQWKAESGAWHDYRFGEFDELAVAEKWLEYRTTEYSKVSHRIVKRVVETTDTAVKGDGR